MPRKAASVEVRFWSHVDKTPGQGPYGNCWLWTGCTDDTGYGAFKICGKKKNSHRIAYELSYGKIVGLFDVMHSCDERRCCNPKHLSLATRRRNVEDASGKQRLAIGERNPNAVLTVGLVKVIRLLHSAANLNPATIAKHLELNPKTVELVVKNETWKHVSI